MTGRIRPPTRLKAGRFLHRLEESARKRMLTPRTRTYLVYIRGSESAMRMKLLRAKALKSRAYGDSGSGVPYAPVSAAPAIADSDSHQPIAQDFPPRFTLPCICRIRLVLHCPNRSRIALLLFPRYLPRHRNTLSYRQHARFVFSGPTI